jgi:hypothetical protein
MPVSIGYAEYNQVKSYIMVPSSVPYDKMDAYKLKLGSYTNLTSILTSGISSLSRYIKYTIVVDHLYMLQNIRNIDLYDFIKLINGNLVNMKGRVLLPEIGITSSGSVQSRDEYYKMHYVNIYHILQNFPGLFRYIHIEYYRVMLSLIHVGLCTVLDPFLWKDKNPNLWLIDPYNV